jgi:uroporphyrinogen-III synthase
MTTLLLIRTGAHSQRLARALAARGERPRVLLSPVFEIRARNIALPRGAELVLTSSNAVAALPPGRWRAWCVGDRTAEAAREAGLEALSAGGDAEALLRLLVEARPGRLLHVRGAHVTGNLTPRLRAAGLEADEVVAYDQAPLRLTPEALAALAGAEAVVLPLYSPRSAALVAGQGGPWRAEVRAVAISEPTARAFARLAHVTVAETPTGEAMEGAIMRALAQADGARLVDRGGAG